MKTPILVFGSSGHAKVIADAISKQNLFRIEAFVSRIGSSSSPTEFLGRPVVDEDSDFSALGVKKGVIAIGDNWRRQLVAQSIQKRIPDFEFVSIVHPSAVVADDVVIGPGSVVMAGAILNSGTKIGRHCVINTKSSLDHDNILADSVSIAPGATLGGNVIVGTCSAIGLGASVIQFIRVGEHTVVGAGSVVVRHVPDLVVAMGAPCKVQRSRQIGDVYLKSDATNPAWLP